MVHVFLVFPVVSKYYLTFALDIYVNHYFTLFHQHKYKTLSVRDVDAVINSHLITIGPAVLFPSVNQNPFIMIQTFLPIKCE